MFKTTNRTKRQAERRVKLTRKPWPFVLHRQAAAATAAIGAVCVFALQMRDRRSRLGSWKNEELTDLSLKGVQDAERREGSP